VPAGHLVADLQLALHGDVDLHHLDHARRQLVALLELLGLLLEDLLEDGLLALGALDDRLDFVLRRRLARLDVDAAQVVVAELIEQLARELLSLGEFLLLPAVLLERAQQRLPLEQRRQAAPALLAQDALLIAKIH
jgi:hypothetical protein